MVLRIVGPSRSVSATGRVRIPVPTALVGASTVDWTRPAYRPKTEDVGDVVVGRVDYKIGARIERHRVSQADVGNVDAVDPTRAVEGVIALGSGESGHQP